MKELFDKISTAKSVTELDLLIKCNSQVRTIVDGFENKYPRLAFKILPTEISKLRTDGAITGDHKISLEHEHFSTLEKLLIAVLWKNGQITRVQSVLDGIVGTKTSDTEYGVIFRQFGRSLADHTEPIVDQHVLRAFCAYGDVSLIKGRKKIPRGAAMKVSDQELIDAYRAWAKTIVQSVSSEESSEFMYKLDKALFAMGQMLLN